MLCDHILAEASNGGVEMMLSTRASPSGLTPSIAAGISVSTPSSRRPSFVYAIMLHQLFVGSESPRSTHIAN